MPSFKLVSLSLLFAAVLAKPVPGDEGWGEDGWGKDQPAPSVTGDSWGEYPVHDEPTTLLK